MSRLRFGYFMAPFHVPGRNPTSALERDLEMAVHLDKLGYDEVWYGEHHSAGSEIVASPEIMIAAAAGARVVAVDVSADALAVAHRALHGKIMAEKFRGAPDLARFQKRADIS